MDKYADEIFETIKFIPTLEEFEKIKEILEKIKIEAYKTGYEREHKSNLIYEIYKD